MIPVSPPTLLTILLGPLYSVLFKRKENVVFPPQALTSQLTDKELAQGRLYPPLANIQEVSINIAIKVSNNLYLFT